MRYYKSIGLGFKTPKSAIDGSYVDKKCPFTGNVSIRGRILKGLVVSTKMKRTIIVRRDYLQYVPKYKRYCKRHANTAAHLSPAFLVKEGDIVTVGQCRPLAKTVKFNVIDHEEARLVSHLLSSSSSECTWWNDYSNFLYLVSSSHTYILISFLTLQTVNVKKTFRIF